jgi:hypothetical protein
MQYVCPEWRKGDFADIYNWSDWTRCEGTALAER